MVGTGALLLVAMAASLDGGAPLPLPLCDAEEEIPELTAFAQLWPASAFHVDVKWDAKAGWIPAKDSYSRPWTHFCRVGR
jgi:hypothetical protein